MNNCRIGRVICTAWLVLGGAVTAVCAAPDRSALIDELGRQGMVELLDRLAETEGGDPVFDGQIEVARLRVRAGDPSLDGPEKTATIEAAIEALSAVIRENPGHRLEPIWRTNLGEMILLDLLQVAQRNAAEFYEFGVPTEAQQQAFVDSVVRAMRELSEADRRFFELRDARGRQDPSDPDRISDVLWRRMSKDYIEGKTPYLLAHAAYYTALLDDDHPYYKNLGDPSLPEQRKRPDQERRRLLELAIDRARRFADDPGDAASIAARCLMGRAMAWYSSSDIARVESVFDSLHGEGFYGLLAELGRSVALRRSGDVRRARVVLMELQQAPKVREKLFYWLLVVDQLHLQMLEDAASVDPSQRTQAVSEAFSVYERMIADPSLGDQAMGLKNYIYQRWESTLAAEEGDGTASDELPMPVMKAVAEMSQHAGRNLMIEADEADQVADSERASGLREQAAPKLERAIELSKRVLAIDDIDHASQAESMYNLGMALYFQADGDVEGQLEAAAVWTRMADELSDQRLAEEAIEIAVSVLSQLHSHRPRPEGVDAGYTATAEVLFDKFPTSKAADDERIYYAYAVLIPSGEYARAADLLAQVPREHKGYFEAQREQLFSLNEMMRRSTLIADRRSAEQRLEEAATRLVHEAEPVSSGPQAASARNAAGWARLMIAELAITRGRTEDAVRELEGFEREYADDEELLRESLAKGIVALAQAGDYDQVLNRAKMMMEKFPDDAAAVIDGVLEDLDARIDQKRQAAAESRVERTKQEMLGQAMTLARTTEGLSQMLLDWAIGQGYGEDDLVAFKLLLAKGRRLAGKPDGAVILLEPLAAKYTDHPGVIHQVAEALFAKGGEPSLIEAASQYDRLIVGLESQEEDELKRIWWNAWMRRLQVSDILNQGVADIPLRVRQLRLTDPNLGGEPFRTVLSKLEVKHGMQ